MKNVYCRHKGIIQSHLDRKNVVYNYVWERQRQGQGTDEDATRVKCGFLPREGTILSFTSVIFKFRK